MSPKFCISFRHCFGKPPPPPQVSVVDLITRNLNDAHSRHLMVLTNNVAALGLLARTGFLGNGTRVLIGSRFRDDQRQMYLVDQINQVKLAMAMGETIVLVNHGNIYESLYDVLNQRYLIKKNARTGQVKKMLRLAIGPRSQLCQVRAGRLVPWWSSWNTRSAPDHVGIHWLPRYCGRGARGGI